MFVFGSIFFTFTIITTPAMETDHIGTMLLFWDSIKKELFFPLVDSDCHCCWKSSANPGTTFFHSNQSQNENSLFCLRFPKEKKSLLPSDRATLRLRKPCKISNTVQTSIYWAVKTSPALFKGTLSRVWIGPCIVLMDSTYTAKTKYRNFETNIPMQKRNIGVSVPISIFKRLWAIYIFLRSVSLFCWRKYADRSWDYKNRSQTHECWNWGWGSAIPRKGIHKMDFRCSVARICKA